MQLHHSLTATSLATGYITCLISLPTHFCTIHLLLRHLLLQHHPASTFSALGFFNRLLQHHSLLQSSQPQQLWLLCSLAIARPCSPCILPNFRLFSHLLLRRSCAAEVQTSGACAACAPMQVPHSSLCQYLYFRLARPPCHLHKRVPAQAHFCLGCDGGPDEAC